MKLYCFDKNTYELIGDIQALLDPLESKIQGRDVYAIPPYTTPIYPEKFEEDKVNVYNTDKKVWELVSDYRGKTVYDKIGNSLIMNKLGEIPNGFSLEKPYIFQEAKLEKLDMIKTLYTEALEEKVAFNKILLSLNDTNLINETIKNNEGKTLVTLNLEEPIIIKYEDLQELRRFLYIRSLLLPIKRKELLDLVKSTKNKTQLEKIKVSFNINKEVLKKLKLSEEEFENYITENS